MESMIKRLRPVMSEVQDISKATLEGIDCICLGGETALGPNYVEACTQMSKICYESEK